MGGRRIMLVLALGTAAGAAVACGAFSGSNNGSTESGAADSGDGATADGTATFPDAGGDASAPEIDAGDASLDVDIVPITDAGAVTPVDCTLPSPDFRTRLVCQDFDHDGGETSYGTFGSVATGRSMAHAVSAPSSGFVIASSGTTGGAFDFNVPAVTKWTLDFDWYDDGMLPVGAAFASINIGKASLALTVTASGVQSDVNSNTHDFDFTAGRWIHVRVSPDALAVDGTSISLGLSGQAGADVKLGVISSVALQAQQQTWFDDVVMTSP